MANKAKGLRVGLIILGLAGGAGVAYLVGRDMAPSSGGGQSNPPVSNTPSGSEAPSVQEDGGEGGHRDGPRRYS